MYEFYTGDKKYQELLHKVKSMMYGESETAEYSVSKYKLKINLVDIDIAASLIPDEDINAKEIQSWQYFADCLPFEEEK
jgi:hypothetical protein